MPELALNPPPYKHAGGTGGVRCTNRVRGNRTGSGCCAGPAARCRSTRRSARWRIRGCGAPAVARHPVAAVPSHHAGASHVDLRADRSGASASAAPGARTGAWMGGRGGRLHARTQAACGHAGSGVGCRPCGTVGAARRASSRAGGCRGVRPAPLGRGGLPPKEIDGLGLATRSVDGPGCRRLAVAGGGGGHAVDGGRRHADRRCSTAGGSARSRAPGAADDGRAAAPSLERHGAAGDQPAPAGGRSAPALVAGARALLGPLVGAPGALAQNR